MPVRSIFAPVRTGPRTLCFKKGNGFEKVYILLVYLFESTAHATGALFHGSSLVTNSCMSQALALVMLLRFISCIFCDNARCTPSHWHVQIPNSSLPELEFLEQRHAVVQYVVCIIAQTWHKRAELLLVFGLTRSSNGG